MGFYLNSTSPHRLFQKECESIYFVDKTDILRELVPLVELPKTMTENSDAGSKKSQKYVCVTRPRRFGKTVMANMIASYFGKGADSSGEFDRLKVSEYKWYRSHLNKHNVIHMMLNELPRDCVAYRQYIDRIQTNLIRDLMRAYPEAGIEKEDAV